MIVLGTCAGFQHAVLEFARNVLGIKDAMHAEAKCWERALKKALQERDEVLRDLVTAARWVDRSAFGPKEKGFG